MLSIYGTGKLANGQFYRPDDLPPTLAATPLGEVGGFDLAWTFFGHSFGYILFIGGTQILGALLLLGERTKLLGAAILLPVLGNIIAIDFFFEIPRGALTSAVLYTLALGYVLFYNRERVGRAFAQLITVATPTAGEQPSFWRRIGVALLVVAGFVMLENQLLNWIGR
jgi:hypothetical protein